MKPVVGLFLILSIFLGAKISAQEIVWQKTIGGSGHDYLSDLKQTIDGGLICLGYTYSGISGDKTEVSRGGRDYWIVNLDSTGAIVWQKTLGSISDEVGGRLLVTNDGGYLVIGSSGYGGGGDRTTPLLGGQDCWMIKLDQSGVIEWQKSYGGSQDEHLVRVIPCADGGYVCCASSNSPISSDKSEGCFGGFDYWIFKIDSLGIIVWQNTIGGNDNDNAVELLEIKTNSYLICGTSSSGISGEKTDFCRGYTDYWLVELDSAGVMVKDKTIGGYYNDVLRSSVNLSNGDIVCVGSSHSMIGGEKPEPARNWSYAYWILCLDTGLNIKWQRTIGGSKFDDTHSVTVDSSNRIIVGGHSEGIISYEKHERSEGIFDNWIVILDSSGQILSQNTFGGNNEEWYLNAIIATDQYIIVGSCSISDSSFDKTEDCKGDHDYWIVKLKWNSNVINGHLFGDFNMDQLRDSSEPNIQQQKIVLQNSNRVTFSNNLGEYWLQVSDTGLYTFSPNQITGYNHIPFNSQSFFPDYFLVDSLNDFAFQPLGSFEDLKLSITPVSHFRPGFNARYNLVFTNVGSVSQTPELFFSVFPGTTFISASVTPQAVFQDSVIWNLPLLSPFQSGSIEVVINISPTTPLGSILNSYAQIRPVMNDQSPSDNNATWEVTITSSMDPNDILVDQDTLFSTVFPNPPYLEYLIRFQNTGTDTAFTVKILNPIDTFKLDLNTLEFVAASHPMDMRFIYHERNMEFLFNNILLPDSNVNEPASHGFVRYRIKPKSNLQSGDTIKNFAAIYFDFNEPVITNTAETKIVTPTGINFIEKNTEIKLYPNPATNELFVEIVGPAGKSFSIDLFNLYGQKTRALYHDRIGNTVWKGKFDLTGLNAGLYLLQYNVDGVTKSVKFVKM